MKYAVINQRGGVNRISDTEPQFVPENATVVEITDEEAALVQAGREAYPKIRYRWVNDGLMLLKDAIALEQFLTLPLEDAKAAKIAELSNRAKTECEADILVDGIGIFHVDADTLHDLKTIEECVTDGTSPILVAGKYPSYKCVDGQMADIGATEITAIKTAMITRKYMTYSVNLKTKVEAVTAATTVEELAAIN
jgi:hypothetical protein